MELQYEDAIKLFESWAKLERLPVLEVLLQSRSLAVHVIAESVSVSPEELTLWYGTKGDGGGSVVLPLHKARITVITADGNPNSLRHPIASHVNRWIEFRFLFSDVDTGCMITEYKPTLGFLAITGFSPLDIALQPKDS